MDVERDRSLRRSPASSANQGGAVLPHSGGDRLAASRRNGALMAVADRSGVLRWSPEWMDSWQRLGARIARAMHDLVPGRYRRIVIGASTPTREYAALMVALGMVRLSYRNRVLPDPTEHYRYLAALPRGTVARAVLGTPKPAVPGMKPKVELGQLRGLDDKGRLKFGSKSLEPESCADVMPFPWAEPTWREDRVEVTYESDFVRDMVPGADPFLFATAATTACAIMGPRRDLDAELDLHVTRSPSMVAPRPLNQVLLPFGCYRHMGWHSVIASGQLYDWPPPVSEGLPRLVILDGAAAVQRWLGETDGAEVVLALVHRSDASASAAAEALLNRRRGACDVGVEELGWAPPSAIEVLAYGEERI